MYYILGYADDVNILGKNINTTKKNRDALLGANRYICVEVNIKKTKYEIWLRSSRNDFSANILVYLQLTGRGHLQNTPLEQLCT
jgi:hypothetical protein